MIYGIFTLIVAVIISAVAAYYSIVGLTAIFAAAVIPIIIMGAALEVGKITAAVWLKVNWHRASITYKLYLVPAVAMLMLLTSMGIFGFLSQAHSDQVLVKGNVAEQVILYDEQIRVERETIENAKSLISQMDGTVQGIIAKGESREIKLRDGSTVVRSPAELALQVRRSQARDRDALTKTIEEAQAKILDLQQKRAPFAADQRAVEAKVGPIKYIAALIYGDNPDNNLLEAAVRWVIIIIVAVFDPLALVLILAAQQSIRWHREELALNPPAPPAPPDSTPDSDDSGADPEQIFDQLRKQARQLDQDHVDLVNQRLAEASAEAQVEPVFEPVEKEPVPEFAPVMQPVVISIDPEPVVLAQIKEPDTPVFGTNTQSHTEFVELVRTVEPEVQTQALPDPDAEYVNIEGKAASRQAARGLYPELMLKADQVRANSTGFGTQWPEYAIKGDVFVRVDYMPNKIYKFNGTKWIEVSKETSTVYSHNEKYIQYLINKIQTGEYDPELLTDSERDQIEEYLTKNNNTNG